MYGRADGMPSIQLPVAVRGIRVWKWCSRPVVVCRAQNCSVMRRISFRLLGKISRRTLVGGSWSRDDDNSSFDRGSRLSRVLSPHHG